MQDVGQPTDRVRELDGRVGEPNEAARVALVAEVDAAGRELREIEQIDSRGGPARLFAPRAAPRGGGAAAVALAAGTTSR